MKFKLIESKKHLKIGSFIKKIGPYTNEMIYFSKGKSIGIKIPNPDKKPYFFIPLSQIKDNVRSERKKSHLFPNKTAIYHDIELSDWYLEQYPWLR